eukprot:m.68108 g.68108  ORF g.68108 m.68108 type:complete len:354 (-) comp12751_c0_seq4:22-1083(-)
MAAQVSLEAESLPVLFQSAVDAHTRLLSTSAMSEEYKPLRDATIEKFELLRTLVRSLQLFSANEDHKEHSTASLRFVLVSAYLGDLYSRCNAAPTDLERDTKRIGFINQSLTSLRDFLELLRILQFPFATDDQIDFFLQMKPGVRRNRDQRIAHMKEISETETKLRELGQLLEIAAQQPGGDEDLLREHHLAFIQSWFLKAGELWEMLTTELNMLQQMQQMRATGELDLRRAPPPPAAREAPLVLTRDMVQQMALENQSITRANFKLITRGYGRIGAPTMSIEEALMSGNACCSLKNCMKKEPHTHTTEEEEEAKAREAESDAAADAATMAARELDEYKDTVRRGDGNRYNMG